MERSKYINTQYQEHLAYWESRLQNTSGKFVFVTEHTDQNESAILKHQLDSHTGQFVRNLVKGNEDGIFVAFFTSLQVLLSRLSLQNEVIVDSPMKKVVQEDVLSLFFVQTIESGKSFKDLLIDNQAHYRNAVKFQNLPIGVLDESLINTCLSNIELLYANIHEKASKYEHDLSIEISDLNETFELKLTYNQGVFTQSSLEQLLKHWETVLKAMQNPDLTVDKFSLADYHPDNSTFLTASFPEQTIHGRIGEIALRFPDKTALSYKNNSLTYQQLNERSNQLAQAMINQFGIKSGDFVSLLLHRSDDMIVSMLAVLKAGAAYVPIDPEYPTDRIAFMLSDSQSSIVISKSETIKESHVDQTVAHLLLDELNWQNFSVDAPQIKVSTEDGAYVIYTSGSTGQPKGVLLSHRNVIRLLINSHFQFDFDENDIWTVFHSFCFDFSVWEMYGPLFYGGKCIVVPKEIAADTNQFVKLVQSEKVTVLNQTPAAFYNFIFSANDLEISNFNLRYVIFGGEALHPIKLESWHKAHPGVNLINMYGITETTVHVTYKEITAAEITNGTSNIGKAIPTLETLVLDQHLLPQAPGFVGELFVGGEGLAISYLNLPELSEQKFITHPFREGKKLYRTGDLARTLDNGELEYLGRIDFQVKIRGFRIELGEIENQMLKLEDIAEVLVLARKSEEDQYLVAYMVTNLHIKPDQEELKKQLSAFLPDYMIPSFFVQLEKIPLTGNGKVNRKLLPDPLLTRSSQTAYEAPETEHEIKLAKLWEKILNFEPIGKKNDFFRSGGHSLKATILISQIRKEWQTELTLGEIFKTPVLEDMAQLIATNKTAFATLLPTPKMDFYPLSTSQRRMFVLDQFEDVGLAYNMPKAIILRGNISAEKIKNTLLKLAERHDALRTSFYFQDGEPMQRITDETVLDFQVKEAIGSTFKELFGAFTRPFNLEQAPLFRSELVQFEQEAYYFMFDMHHIISDFISMQIITGDFIDLFNDKTREPIAIQYKDFAVWQQSEEAQLRLIEQKKYWENRFRNGLSILEIPTDFPRPHLKSFDGGLHKFFIDLPTKLALKQISGNTGSTMYMTVLSLFNIFLSKYTNNSQVIVGTPVTGRSSSELDQVVGFFVNSVAMQTEIDKQTPFTDYLNEFKNDIINDFIHQDYPFEMLVNDLNVTPDLSRNPVFDVMYTFINTDQEIVSLDGIRVEHPSVSFNISKFDIVFTVVDRPDGLECAFEYATSLFKPETIKRMGEHFCNLAEQVAKNPNQKIVDYQLFNEADKAVLDATNNTFVEIDFSDTVIHQLQDVANKYPELNALVFEEQHLNYKEFYHRVSTLAAQLKSRGIKENDIVGIISTPSLEMIVSMFAVLRSGAAFLPIDTSLPAERVEYMLEDSAAVAVLSYGITKRYNDQQIILEDFDWNLTFDDTELAMPKAEDLAYLIYTSGSTGKPKGVKITHLSLVNVNKWNIDCFMNKPGVSGTKYAGFSFDATIIEVFPIITTGGELHVINNELRLDLDELVNYFNENQIKNCFLPTKIAEQILDYELPYLSVLNTGGEKLNRYIPTTYTIYNSYGPTENTVDTSFFEVTKEYVNIPIGKPINNVRVYIREPESSHLVGVGIPGELCITGESLATGYLNRDDLTEEKFVPCPFEPGNKMYLTGDLCRLLPDGNIEFLGRIDKQVKIRGYRIETGEIEQQLAQLDGIKEAVVLLRKVGTENVLCAYIVSDDFDAGIFKSKLRNFLPDYMVPGFFVQIPEIPLTPNGKADNTKLLQIAIESGAAVTTPFVAPETELQQQIANIWAEVLKVQKIGIHDNFFELGGNSLQVVKLLKQLNDAFPGKFQISQLFDQPTVFQLAEIIVKMGSEEETATTDENETRIIDF